MPYLFNGKELDTETNLTYFGARYLDMKTSLWLNTDPLSGYNPIQETEHYIDGQHNGGIYNPMNMATYSYTYQNPVIYVDPNGKQNYFTHGTWSDKSTFKDIRGLKNATYRVFGNKEKEYLFSWSGYNDSGARTIAAKNIVNMIKETMSRDINEPITLVGHSHGGNVNIEAINMMVEMPEFKDRKINLLTINTPVRQDYQLSEKAKNRVNHVNIYDLGDMVQTGGGNSTFLHATDDSGRPAPRGSVKYTSGEFGKAGRLFNGATNIQVNDHNGLFEDMHNSHNRVNTWIYKLPKQDER